MSHRHRVIIEFVRINNVIGIVEGDQKSHYPTKTPVKHDDFVTLENQNCALPMWLRWHSAIV